MTAQRGTGRSQSNRNSDTVGGKGGRPSTKKGDINKDRKGPQNASRSKSRAPLSKKKKIKGDKASFRESRGNIARKIGNELGGINEEAREA